MSRSKGPGGFGGGKGGFGGGKGRGAKAGRKVPYKNPNPSAFEELGEGTGDLEADSKVEIDAIAEAFRQRAKNEEERFDLAVDADFWFTVCFKSRADRNAFIKALDIGNAMYRDRHFDGYLLSDMLGLEVKFKNR